MSRWWGWACNGLKGGCSQSWLGKLKSLKSTAMGHSVSSMRTAWSLAHCQGRTLPFLVFHCRVKTWHRRIQTGVKVRGRSGAQQIGRCTKACVSRTRPPASARGNGGTGQIRGREGPGVAVPEEAALLYSLSGWCSCRAWKAVTFNRKHVILTVRNWPAGEHKVATQHTRRRVRFGHGEPGKATGSRGSISFRTRRNWRACSGPKGLTAAPSRNELTSRLFWSGSGESAPAFTFVLMLVSWEQG